MSRQPSPTKRTRRLTILISEDEAWMLRSLAIDDGLNVSSVVRLLIRRAYEQCESSKRLTRSVRKSKA